MDFVYIVYIMKLRPSLKTLHTEVDFLAHFALLFGWDVHQPVGGTNEASRTGAGDDGRYRLGGDTRVCRSGSKIRRGAVGSANPAQMEPPQVNRRYQQGSDRHYRPGHLQHV